MAVTAFNNQMVNQAVSLQCAVTAVRGIMSRVDILWSSGGTELQRVDGVPRGMSDSAQVIYTNSYDTLPLNTTDDGRMIQCQVVINTTPPVIANGSITLDVTGEYYITFITWLISLSTHSSQSYGHCITYCSHTRSYGG